MVQLAFMLVSVMSLLNLTDMSFDVGPTIGAVGAANAGAEGLYDFAESLLCIIVL